MVPASVPAPGDRLPPRAHYALTVLTALNCINVWHRYLIANLSAVSVGDCAVCDDVGFIPLCDIDEQMESSERDCLSCRFSYSTEFYNLKDGACINNAQYSTLAGVGFTIAFAIATLFAGRLTDTLNRRLLHTGAILTWSLAAAAHGVCNDYSCLLVSQIVLGIGEAFNAPACYALITLYFPHSRRATANGIYSTGTYLGTAMSSLCLALAVQLGWRNTAFLSGLIGVLVAAILFLTVEHNPVMPPSNEGYTKLPDDNPDDSLSLLPSPMTTMTGAGRRKKVVSFAGGGDGRGTGGERASSGACVGGKCTAADDGDEPKLAASYGSVLPQATCSAAAQPLSPSASSTSSTSSSTSSYDNSVVGGDGPAPGGALGSGGGDIAPARSEVKAVRPARFVVVEKSASSSPRRKGGDTGVSGDRKSRTKRRAGAGDEEQAAADSGGDLGGALLAVGAARDPNGSGWGWYEEDPVGVSSRASEGRWEDVGGDEGDGGEGGGGGEGGESRKHDLRHALKTIVSNRVVLLLFLASSARMIATWAMAVYMSVYYKRMFPSKTSMYSVLNAGFVSVGGMASSCGGGALSDRLRVRNEGFLGYIPAIGSLLAILPVAVVLNANDFYVSVIALFVTYIVGECWLGPGMACLQMELPKEVAGTSVAILLFLNSVICNVGTWFIGKVDGGIHGGLATIRRPFFAVLFLSYGSSFLLFGWLGLMVSKKHQRRNSSLSNLHTVGNLEDGAEAGPAFGFDNRGKKEYYGVGDGGGGVVRNCRNTRVPSMCELVRRTFSRQASNASPSGFPDSGDARERDGYGELYSNTSGQHCVVGGGGGMANSVNRPLLPRGRPSTRGYSAAGGGRKQGVTATAAAAEVLGGEHVSSMKMR